MSGGVDSSVAAALMVEAGYECIGVTMKLFDNEDVSIPLIESCYEDYLDVQHYLYPGTINFVNIKSKRPFKLVHEDTKEELGSFREFFFNGELNVINSEDNGLTISEKQGKDLLDGKYDFNI